MLNLIELFNKMMFKGFCPIRAKKQRTIEYQKIEIPGYASFYLQKLGYTMAKEALSEEDEEAINQQIESQYIMLSVIAEIAEKEKISAEAAQKKLFGVQLKDIQLDEFGEPIVDESAIPTESESQLAMLRWMGESRFKAFFKALASKKNNRKAVESIATSVIQNRILYPVVAAKAHRTKLDELEVEPLMMPIAAGSKIQFGEYAFEVAKNVPAAEDDESVSIIPLKDELNIKLPVGAVGFLIDSDGVKVGFKDWTLAHTKSLPDAPVDAAEMLYQFYMSERSMSSLTDNLEEPLTEGKSGNSSQALSPAGGEYTSTTQISTTESNQEEPATPSLAG